MPRSWQISQIRYLWFVELYVAQDGTIQDSRHAVVELYLQNVGWILPVVAQKVIMLDSPHAVVE